MFLDRYSKMVPPPGLSEGTAFAQKGASKKKGAADDSDKKKEADGESNKKKKRDPYADMKCFACGKDGHPARFCPNKSGDESSVSSAKSKTLLNKLKKSFG